MFNVKVQAEEDSGSLLLIVVILVAVIGVLGPSSSFSPAEAVEVHPCWKTNTKTTMRTK